MNFHTCGADFTTGTVLATVDGVVYCHPDQYAPTCYERASLSKATQAFVQEWDDAVGTDRMADCSDATPEWHSGQAMGCKTL
jgi:hypothetical protein